MKRAFIITLFILSLFLLVACAVNREIEIGIGEDDFNLDTPTEVPQIEDKEIGENNNNSINNSTITDFFSTKKETGDDSDTSMNSGETAPSEYFEDDTLIPVNTYYLYHDLEDTTYVITILRDDNYIFSIQLADLKFDTLQFIHLDNMIFGGIYFEDVNCDGYTDIVVNTGGTLNETHELYIWNTTFNNFSKVFFDGFDMLAEYEVNYGYIKNWVKESASEGVVQKLVWNGSILTMEWEEWYGLDESDNLR